jgi:hypothetical protein
MHDLAMHGPFLVIEVVAYPEIISVVVAIPKI